MIYAYKQMQNVRNVKAHLYIFGTHFDPRVTRCGSGLFRYLIESGPSGHPRPAGHGMLPLHGTVLRYFNGDFLHFSYQFLLW